jgi:hypothetical protein
LEKFSSIAKPNVEDAYLNHLEQSRSFGFSEILSSNSIDFHLVSVSKDFGAERSIIVLVSLPAKSRLQQGSRLVTWDIGGTVRHLPVPRKTYEADHQKRKNEITS